MPVGCLTELGPSNRISGAVEARGEGRTGAALLCPSLEPGSGLHRAAMSAGDYDSARGITGMVGGEGEGKNGSAVSPTHLLLVIYFIGYCIFDMEGEKCV